jgi:hypothetical protein
MGLKAKIIAAILAYLYPIKLVELNPLERLVTRV